MWQRASEDVSAAWEQDWQALAPGADVINGILAHFGLDGFSKSADGPKIAASTAAPEELRTILQSFIA